MLIQVSKRRSNGFVSAKRLNSDGSIVHSINSLCVVFPKAFRDAVNVGSIWEVNGNLTESTFTANGYTVTEDCLDAETVRFVKPNTHLLETWLRKNVDGIGEVKAGRLARHPHLIEIITQKQANTLLDLGVPERSIGPLMLNFPSQDYMDAINWLATHELPVRLASSLAAAWCGKTIQLLEENPFRLMRFNLSFRRCCGVAEKFGFDASHPKYKAALAVDFVSQYCRKTSSTLMPRSAFEEKCRARRVDLKEIMGHAMDQELIGYIRDEDGFQLEGEFLLEALTGKRLREAALRSPGSESDIAGWECALTTEEVTQLLHEFEETISFDLTEEQRGAVALACRENVIALSGGAGTGKTTLLRAILTVLEKASLGVDICQVALSGRAAQKMAEATGRPASTIAKFCIDMSKKSPDKRPDHCVAVIDEASMVDLHSMHRLLRFLPKATRFIFVGDVDQLPPIGGGLVFHNLMKSGFPAIELTAVKRQGEKSGIHRLATAIRHQHSSIKLPEYQEGGRIDCSVVHSIDPVQISNLFDTHGGLDRCIVLTSMRKGDAGVENLNKVMQRKLGYDRPVIRVVTDHGNIDFVNFQGHKFYLNDPIMITKNDYNIGVRNGDLGTIAVIFDAMTEDGSLGLVNINNRMVDLTSPLIEKMDLGYATTIHKAQGSQWESVILVLDRKSQRMLDKTLLYTGATRAQKKLIICCEDMDLIHRAVDRGSIALQRKTNLLQHLNADLCADPIRHEHGVARPGLNGVTHESV